MKGTIEYFSEEKGFGFIKPDEKVEDIIFQRKNFHSTHIFEGQRVEFKIIEGEQGLEAVEVESL